MSRDIGHSPGACRKLASPSSRSSPRSSPSPQRRPEYGYSRRHLHRLLARYRDGGLEAVEPRSRRPRTEPAATPRRGPRTDHRAAPATHQGRAWTPARSPSPGTSNEKATGRRRPRRSAASCTPPASSSPSPANDPAPPTAASQPPNPTSAGSPTSPTGALADGTDVEILNWLDDHSRYLLACTAHTPVTGDLVASTFLTAADEHGFPASTLTDNGRVYTARFGGGRNAFEYLLPVLGHHPEERPPRPPPDPRQDRTLPPDPQTLARPNNHQPRPWPTSKPSSTRFRDLYNHHRPHRELDRHTPATAYAALPKAHPASPRDPGTTDSATTASTPAAR